MNLLSAGDTETPGLEGSWIQMGEPSTKTETKTNSPHPPQKKKKKPPETSALIETRPLNKIK
jgi:hypothetical protein